MSFFSEDQKKMLGPLFGLVTVILAVAGGIAINTWAGGPRVPVISDFAAIILGVVTTVILLQQLRK